MDVIRYDENSDIVTYDRIISSLMIESDEDADQALKILNSRPDDKDFIIKHYRIIRRDNSHTFSPNNIIIKVVHYLFAPELPDAGILIDALSAAFLPDPEVINNVLDNIEDILDPAIFAYYENLYYGILSKIAGASRYLIWTLNHPSVVRKKCQPSKYLESMFLQRDFKNDGDGYIDTLGNYTPKPYFYQTIWAIVELNKVVFDEKRENSVMALSAAKEWLDKNAPRPIKSARKK